MSTEKKKGAIKSKRKPQNDSSMMDCQQIRAILAIRKFPSLTITCFRENQRGDLSSVRVDISGHLSLPSTQHSSGSQEDKSRRLAKRGYKIKWFHDKNIYQENLFDILA